MVEEGVAALQCLFSQRVATFEGKYYKFRDVELFPKPLQARLPIYFGGNSPNHLRRVAATADGWIPAGMPADRLATLVSELKELVAKAGRDPAQIAVAPQYVARVARKHEDAIARYQASQMHKHMMSLRQSTLKGQAGLAMEDINLIGSVDAVVEKALRLKAAGVTHFLGLYFAANDVQDLIDQMQLFAEEVTPRIV
jgi:alkanesulfonate monooxygenase SsuD/methylene tetrahydromethanopterin reductase-like flavin-dependent oxidoreductase (luciferase family)